VSSRKTGTGIFNNQFPLKFIEFCGHMNKQACLPPSYNLTPLSARAVS
jgi:hypothetical protein